MREKEEISQARFFNLFVYVLVATMVLALISIILVIGYSRLADNMTRLTFLAYLLMVLVDFPLVVIQYFKVKGKIMKRLLLGFSITFGIQSVACIIWMIGAFVNTNSVGLLSVGVMMVAFLPAIVTLVNLLRLPESRQYDPAVGNFVIFINAAAALLVIGFTVIRLNWLDGNMFEAMGVTFYLILDLVFMALSALLALNYVRSEHRYVFMLIFACAILSLIGDGFGLITGFGSGGLTLYSQFFLDVMLIAATIGIVGISLTEIKPTTVEEVDKKLSDTRMQMVDIVTQSPDAMGLFNTDGSLLMANAKFHSILGSDADSPECFNLFERARDTSPGFVKRLEQVRTGLVISEEDMPIYPDGSLDNPLYMSITVFPTFSSDNQVSGIVFFAQDTTARRQAELALKSSNEELESRVLERTAELERTNVALQREVEARKEDEEQIKASLNEKEVLLKEIHHRVKNNLQIVSSMLSLQSSMVGDPAIASMNMDCQNRIRSMALIHEKLYQSRNLSSIDFEEYVRSLTGFILGSYRTKNVNTVIDIDSVWLDIDTAIPCGLIINELFSNCLKHAFQDMDKGEVYIGMKAEENRFRLTVKDNGSGMERTVDLDESTTLGLSLVSALVGQLEGEVEIKSDSGTEFVIWFPLVPGKRKTLLPEL